MLSDPGEIMRLTTDCSDDDDIFFTRQYTLEQLYNCVVGAYHSLPREEISTSEMLSIQQQRLSGQYVFENLIGKVYNTSSPFYMQKKQRAMSQFLSIDLIYGAHTFHRKDLRRKTYFFYTILKGGLIGIKGLSAYVSYLFWSGLHHFTR
jgi:hypothetical protein